MNGPITARRASPTEHDISVAMVALQDARNDAESDARRAREQGDDLAAEDHSERAERLDRVLQWMEHDLVLD